MRIVWTKPALRDLLAVRAYIALENPAAGDRQIDLVMKAAGNLMQFPNMGLPGRRKGTRELVVGRTPFLLPYRVNGDRIDILRVLHGRQRWPDDFE